MVIPEPVTITSTVLTITTKAVQAGIATYDLIKAIKSAPEQISRTADDVHSLYKALATLERLLGGEISAAVTDDMLDDLRGLLNQCIQIFQEIQTTLGPLLRDAKVTIWKAVKWVALKKNDIDVLQKTLGSYKLSLNLACSFLSIRLTAATNEGVSLLLEEIRKLQMQVENLNAAAREQALQTSIRPDDYEQSRPLENRLSVMSFNEPIEQFLEGAQTALDRYSISLRFSLIDLHGDSENADDDSADNEDIVSRHICKDGDIQPQLQNYDNDQERNGPADNDGSSELRPNYDHIVEQLHERVKDWKSLTPSNFGPLLQYGTYLVKPGRSRTEKYYSVYLFKEIMLFCRDSIASIQVLLPLISTLSEPPNSETLLLRGRIYIANIYNILSEDRLHRLNLHFQADEGADALCICFPDLPTLLSWNKDLNRARTMLDMLSHDRSPHSVTSESDDVSSRGTSQPLPTARTDVELTDRPTGWL